MNYHSIVTRVHFVSNPLTIEQASTIDIQRLKHLKFEQHDDGYRTCLIDGEGYEILIGYGRTVEDSISDLLFNLI